MSFSTSFRYLGPLADHYIYIYASSVWTKVPCCFFLPPLAYIWSPHAAPPSTSSHPPPCSHRSRLGCRRQGGRCSGGPSRGLTLSAPHCSPHPRSCYEMNPPRPRPQPRPLGSRASSPSPLWRCSQSRGVGGSPGRPPPHVHTLLVPSSPSQAKARALGSTINRS